MKKALSLLAAVAVVAMASSAMAAAFQATKHDMTSYINGAGANATGSNKEICVYCHTPHNASVTRALWNRVSPAAGGFRLYTSGANDEAVAWFKSGTIGTLASTSSSLMCLSCHDGVTTIDNASVVKKKGTLTLTNNLVSGNANLGQNLTNDHPINLNYVTVQAAASQTGKLNAAAAGMVGTAKLVNTTDLECASCHDVHKISYSPFLRDTMAGSVLCLQCHAK